MHRNQPQDYCGWFRSEGRPPELWQSVWRRRMHDVAAAEGNPALRVPDWGGDPPPLQRMAG